MLMLGGGLRRGVMAMRPLQQQQLSCVARRRTTPPPRLVLPSLRSASSSSRTRSTLILTTAGARLGAPLLGPRGSRRFSLIGELSGRRPLFLAATRNAARQPLLAASRDAAAKRFGQRQVRVLSSGPSRSLLSRAIGVGGFAALFLGKIKYVFVALKLTKFAPVISMVISSGMYSLVYGPAYGCGMVGLIFVHECGHAIAMRYYGIPFSPMVFIPFMGAMIQMKDSPKGAFQQSVIALAGPYFGTAAAVGCAVVGHASDSQLLMALADWGFLVNLFNCLPIGGLDGGHVGDALHPAIPATGLAGGCALVYCGIVSNPIFYLILLGGAFQVGGRALGWTEPPPSYMRLKGFSMFGVASAYAAIVAGLIAAMAVNNVGRKSPKRLLAEQKGEVYDVPPGGAADDPYDEDYFAVFVGGASEDDDF